MHKHLLAAVASLALVAAILAAPVEAQQVGETGAKLTPQRQKMRDCAVRWKEEKATKHVSGRVAYRAFMKECLKGG
jgi:hypothetical protein